MNTERQMSAWEIIEVDRMLEEYAQEESDRDYEDSSED